MALHPNEPPAETRRITLTVGLFDSAVALVCAMRDLTGHGYDGDRFRIVVADDSQGFDARNICPLEGVVPVCRIPAADLREGATPMLWVDRALPWLADPTATTGELHDPAIAPGPRGAASSVLDRQNRRLALHLASGGAAMIAPIEAISDQQAICSIMLHYASAGVLTHQIRAALAENWPHIATATTRGAPLALRCT